MVPEGAVTLEECLREFMAEEELSEDNKWQCPKCKDFRPATKVRHAALRAL